MTERLNDPQRADKPGAPNYRKKPVVIQAKQYDGTNSEDVIQALGMRLSYDVRFTPTGGMILTTLESNEHLVSVGDFVIKGVKGEFYACKPDIFAATYEPASTPRSAGTRIPDAELLLDNAATASQVRELLRDYEGNETVLREAVRRGVYEPLAKLLRAQSASERTADDDLCPTCGLFKPGPNVHGDSCPGHPPETDCVIHGKLGSTDGKCPRC